MTVNFNTNWFEEQLGLHTIKLNYSGAYPKDQSNIMKLIFESGNQVEAVFLGIDVMTYTGGVEETKYPIPEYLYDNNVINDIQYIFNKDVVLNYIFRQVADPDKTDLATVYQSWWTDEYYNKQWVMHNYEQPERVAVETPADAYLESVEQNLAANICPYIEQNPDTVFYLFFRRTAFCTGMMSSVKTILKQRWRNISILRTGCSLMRTCGSSFSESGMDCDGFE